MSNYSQMAKGDHLPTVGVLQKLLNRNGAKLTVDGRFGPQTFEAVKAFQRARAALVANGLVNNATWSRLAAQADLPIFDCIDVFDPNLYEGDTAAIRQAGGNPLLVGGMCNGMVQAAHEITTRARNVYLLRFIGHGRSGFENVASGKGGEDVVVKGKKIWHDFGDQVAALHIQVAGVIWRSGMQNIFGDYGSVELHGCNVGTGIKGHSFVRALANGLGVPVTAACGFGKRGEQQSTFKFDGPTFTGFPNGGNMRSWCKQLPDFPPMTIR